jgi:hypothetical protein
VALAEPVVEFGSGVERNAADAPSLGDQQGGVRRGLVADDLHAIALSVGRQRRAGFDPSDP